MVQTNVLNYSVQKIVGEVSEGKVKKICENGFSMSNFIVGQFAQFVYTRTGDILIVAQNQIIYAATAANVDSCIANPGKIIDVFSIILDILMLDVSNANIEMTLERTYPSKVNTFRRSLSLLREDFSTSIGSQFIGFRIPFIRENFQGEARFEPFFSDSSRYFLGCKMITKQPCKIEEAGSMWANMTKMITEELEPLVGRLFGEEG
jgi:hypothetical protein